MNEAEFTSARIDALFAAIDSKDTDGFVSFLTAQASFRFASAPAVTGRADIATAVDAFFATIKTSSHTLAKVVSDGNTLMCEGEVLYTRLDDSKISIPFVDVFELQKDLISDYRIYIDISPLFAG